MFTFSNHDIALVYTALTNIFDILRPYNVALQDLISFITCSTMKEYSAAFVSWPQPRRTEEERITGWLPRVKGRISTSIYWWTAGREQDGLTHFRAYPLSVGAFCTTVLWTHSCPAYTCAIEKWNEYAMRPSEWTGSALHLPYLDILTSPSGRQYESKNISWYNPATRVFLFDTRQCPGPNTTAKVNSIAN